MSTNLTPIDHIITLRAYEPADKNFVCATFLKGLYYGDSWFTLIPKDVFMTNYKRVIEAVINKPTVTIVMACLKDDPDVLVGYSILDEGGNVLHWVYVKSAWRLQGFGKLLVPQTVTTLTHLTRVGKTLMNKLPNAQFNPFAL